MKNILVVLISFYQSYLSFDKGLLAIFAPGGACKYVPSCSEYAKKSIDKFGVIRGSVLGLKRIWNCK